MRLSYQDANVRIEGASLVRPEGPTTYVVHTRNIHEETDPVGHEQVSRAIQEVMQSAVEAGVERSTNPYVGREGRRRLVAENPFAARYWSAPDEPHAPKDRIDFDYMASWREQVPSARALWPLQNPTSTRLPFTDEVTGAKDRLFWQHVADAVGIRSRAATMAAVLGQQLDRPENARWLSLASGAAVPVLAAADHIREEAGITPQITLLDFDDEALNLAQELAAEMGLTDALTTEVIDLFDLDGLAGRVDRGRFDVVDILGFFEYLPDQPVPVGDDHTVPSASEFLKAALSLVADDGLVVLANMRETHPQLDFVLRVVQWPYIRPRSTDQLVDMICDAGVAADRITLLLPDDQVYSVALISS